MGQCFYFYKKLRHRVRHTGVHAAWIFADVARGKMASEIPEFFLYFWSTTLRL